MHNNDTKSIIDGCLRGEAQWQRALYNKYSARIYALCLRYAYDPEVAKDIMIEGFIKVYNSIEQYRGDGPFEAWMQRIFIFTAYHFYNLYKREGMIIMKTLSGDSVANNYHPEEQMNTRDALNVALEKLNKDDRIIFNMIAVEGYKFSEVAQITKMPESSAKTRYYRARRSMQESLKRMGFNANENQQEKNTTAAFPLKTSNPIKTNTL